MFPVERQRDDGATDRQRRDDEGGLADIRSNGQNGHAVSADHIRPAIPERECELSRAAVPRGRSTVGAGTRRGDLTD